MTLNGFDKTRTRERAHRLHVNSNQAVNHPDVDQPQAPRLSPGRAARPTLRRAAEPASGTSPTTYSNGITKVRYQ